jgi:purine-binding chemotaxis protein CheW
MVQNEESQAGRYLTFRVGPSRYALPAALVAEVIRLQSLARVPHAPAALLGVTNLRGAVVPVVGLRELLGQGSTPDQARGLALMLDVGAPAALLIDAVETLEAIADEEIELADAAWREAGGEKIHGALKSTRSRDMTRILDIDGILSTAFTQRPAATRRGRVSPGVLRRETGEQQADDTQMFLAFEVGAQEFALPLTAVDELLPLPAHVAAITRPDAIVAGFASIRDVLTPLLSLRGLLGFESSRQTGNCEKVLVLKVAGAAVGLVVDDVRGVVAAPMSLMEPVPAVLTARTRAETRIQAVYRGEGGRRLISILSPELLFADEVVQRLAKVTPNMQISAKAAAEPVQDPAIFLVFRLGQDEFALAIDAVVEVAAVPPQITRLPKSPKFLEGVINLRGEVLPIIDQRRRFELPHPDDATRRLVVVKTASLRAGIIVDSVTDILHTSAAAIAPPPELTAQLSRLVRGVVNLHETQRLILLLDPTELLTRAEQGQLESFQTQSKKAGA